MPTLLSLICIGQWDQILSSANLCSTSCSVSHTHGPKKKPPKKPLTTVYTRNKLKMVFCFTNAFWITLSPYLTDAPGLYCYLQSKLVFFKIGLHFALFLYCLAGK